MQVKIYVTNLDNKSSPRKPINSNERRVGETKFVPTARAICGKKTEHSRLKPVEAYEIAVTPYRYLRVCNQTAWEASNRIKFFPFLQ
jgi:hypothetical protein